MLGPSRRRLRDWVSHGLISDAQADAIVQFEGKRTGFGWAAYGIAGIGVTAIITGIISLIAANWETIPPEAKLGIFFAALAGTAAAILKVEKREGLAREVLISLFALMPLAGIGLVGQIYHLSGGGWSALLFWLAMILPVTLLAHSRFINHVWFVSLVVTACIWFVAYADGGRNDDQQIATAACMLLGLLFVFAGLGQATFKHLRLPVYFREALSIWPMLIIVIGGSLCGSILAIDGADHEVRRLRQLIRPTSWIWVGVILYGAMLHLGSQAHSKRLKACLTALSVVAVLYTLLPLYGLPLSALASAIVFMILWSLAAACAVFSNRKMLFDLCTFVVGARLVIVYFEVFGSMLMTGIGLIVSGMLILAAVYVWYKYRGRAFKWLES